MPVHKKGGTPSSQKSTPNVPKGKEGTAAWAGVPGPTQPGDRSAGVKKIKQSMKQEGL